MKKPESVAGIGRYKVGSVAQLTGLSAHVIRAWERRYGSVVPQRSAAGTRLYSEEDVDHLQLLKALVDLGDTVGSIAGLSKQELRERLAAHGARARRETSEETPVRSARLALLAPELSHQIRLNPSALAGLETCVEETAFDAFLTEIGRRGSDFLVISLDALGGDPVADIRRCREIVPGAAVFALYGFARQGLLGALADEDVYLVRNPVRIALLRRMLLGHREPGMATRLRERVEPLHTPPGGVLSQPQPTQRFEPKQLAQLQELRSSVACECPAHIAGLVADLLAFQHYSERCISEQPLDSELHSLLARGSGHARSIMEELLIRVCEHGGIRVPDGGTRPQLVPGAEGRG